MNKKIDILGVNFDKVNSIETLDIIYNVLKNEKKDLFQISTVNPEIVMLSKNNRKFKVALNNSDLVLPDGIGIIYGSKILKDPLEERVTGFDTTISLFNLFEKKSERIKVFLLGSNKDNILRCVANLRNDYKYVEIVGYNDGYFKKEDEVDIIKKINDSEAELLLVGLGAPKQELFIYENKNNLNVKIAMGVGGSFDVISGNVKRAPEIVQKINMEWFWRLANDPKRLKRQLAIPKFIIGVLKQKNN